MSQIATAAVAVQVARALEEEITSNGFKPGHFIGRRQELAARFSVAPATLGEAIQLLRSRGIVDAKPGPGGGIFVSERSPFAQLSDHLLALREEQTTAEQCLRVLDALDGAVLRDAVDFATEDDIADIARCADELQEAWGTSESAATMWRLHERIAQTTPNELLRGLYTNLVKYITEELDDAVAPHTEERLHTHLDFAKAVVERDHELAASAIARHTHPASGAGAH